MLPSKRIRKPEILLEKLINPYDLFCKRIWTPLLLCLCFASPATNPIHRIAKTSIKKGERNTFGSNFHTGTRRVFEKHWMIHKPNNKSPPIYFWLSFETINVHNRRALEAQHKLNWFILLFPCLSPPSHSSRRSVWAINDDLMIWFPELYLCWIFSKYFALCQAFINFPSSIEEDENIYKYLKTINSLSAPLSFSCSRETALFHFWAQVMRKISTILRVSRFISWKQFCGCSQRQLSWKASYENLWLIIFRI